MFTLVLQPVDYSSQDNIQQQVLQLDLGYPAISYPDISVYPATILQYILSIFN